MKPLNVPLNPGTEIEWDLFPKALEYYKVEGFSYIEVPWLVAEEHINVTRPSWSTDHMKVGQDGKYGELIASGEQGFIALAPPPGRYQTITPCFRPEPVVDSLHQLFFMKLELYDSLDIHEQTLYSLVQCSRHLFMDLSGMLQVLRCQGFQ